RADVEVFSEDEVKRLKSDTPPLEEPSVGTVKAIGKFERLTREPVKERRFTDATVDLSKPGRVEKDAVFTHRFRSDQLDENGKPYRFGVFAYRVRAVNHLGVAGGLSPWCVTIPSAPQWGFARRAGEQCRPEWAVHPEAELAG